MPADVTHIRFVRGSAEQQMNLLGLIGRVKLEIVDFTSPASPEAAAMGAAK
jgi:hypothetical protein